MADELELKGGGSQTLESVEEFKFDKLPPIKGFPELRWAGKRPFTSTQFYPAQKKESYGKPVDGWMNKILWGDNLQVMSHLLKEFRGEVDLIYIDPPFDSKADYKKQISPKKKLNASSDHSSFEEKQYSDIWTNDNYLQFMYDRLRLCRELLAENGSIYIHVDFHKIHQIRCLMDEIFGLGAASGSSSPGFRNEIIWCYSGGGTPTSEMPRKHDNLLWYTRSADWTFNTQYRPYSEGTMQRGRTAVKGENAELREEGTPINDWWPDVKRITSPTDFEKLYYPTQKSEELLNRIIQMHTDEGDLVFDCFMGSGTTQASAMKLGRRFIGADINLGAIETTSKRLVDILSISEEGVERAGFEIYNVNNYDVFRNPVEAKEILIEALEIQPLDRNGVFDGVKDGYMVKIMPVTRIATRQDLNELITGLDQKAYAKKYEDNPNKPVDQIMLVCMGHEPDLSATLKEQLKPYDLDVQVVDVLRDKSHLEFKRSAEARVVIRESKLIIENFYPMNLLQKLSIQQEELDEWRQLVESIKIDWNYDGAVLEPQVIDVPEGDDFVAGTYDVPDDAGTIRIKITDLLSESLEMNVDAEA